MKIPIRRSPTDVVFGGLCGGLAAYLDLEPRTVRILTVLAALFTPVPVPMLYLLALLVVPVAAEGELDEDGLEFDWRADGLQATWSGQIVPYAVSWQRWLGAVAALAAAAVVPAVLFIAVGLLTPWVSIPPEVLDGLVGLGSAVVLGGSLLTFAGLSRRPYALTVTHDAVWVERPLRATIRINLADVWSVHDTGAGLSMLLRNGELIRLPPSTEPQDIATVLEQLESGRRRALEHKVDLQAAEGTRRELERLRQ